MPLIKCPDCGKEVSSFAETCPNCGYPFAKLEAAEQERQYKAEQEARRLEHLKNAPKQCCANCIHYGKYDYWNDNAGRFETKTGCTLKRMSVWFKTVEGKLCDAYKWKDEDNY